MDLSIFKNKYPWPVGIRQKEDFKKIDGGFASITTGEIHEEVAIITRKRYDNEKFTKVYQSLIKAKFGFKPATQRIVDFIIANLPQNDPDIAIDLGVITSYFRGLKHDIKLNKNDQIMSRQTFSTALKELIENDVIAPTGLGAAYYINANLIHNGDRIIIAEIIERTGATEQDKLEANGQVRIDE